MKYPVDQTRHTSIGIDIGGTFTDAVFVDPEGNTKIAKLPSTRADPSVAVNGVLTVLARDWGVEPRELTRFIHGTTVATNEVLERKGARLGILTTDGFTDVLEIGRQNRQDLYDLIIAPQTPSFLASGAFREGVVERLGPTGEVLVPLDEASLAESVENLVERGAQSIAICFLFSYMNPDHERQAAAFVKARYPSVSISLSSDVDPEFREYERTCCTAFDAYVKPGLDRYLGAMEATLRREGIEAPLQVMQSRGGVCSSEVARLRPVRMFLSGPAAGVIGAKEVGAAAGYSDLITVDIGGTSSDIALIMDGKPMISPEGLVDSYKIRVPMVDVNAVGAGGGSVAWIDAAGGLRVGPESAGADPGPACYGRGGTQATVTDASVVLGLLNPRNFAGGSLELDPDEAAAAIETNVADALGIGLADAALGIHRVANVQMAEGIRLVSVRRGIDPRGFTLVAFGGAGALHATSLADELGIETILVPRNPGVLSASGLLAAKVEHEVSAALMRDLDEMDVAELKAEYAKLVKACADLMAREAVSSDSVVSSYFADLCYVGQSHYVEVAVRLEGSADPIGELRDNFFAHYQQLYGHYEDAPLRLVNLRVVQQAGGSTTAAQPHNGPQARESDPPQSRRIMTARTGGYVAARVYQRTSLGPGEVIEGPAIIEQLDTTVLIDVGWSAKVAAGEILVMSRGS